MKTIFYYRRINRIRKSTAKSEYHLAVRFDIEPAICYLIRTVTGQNTQQHIHEKVIKKAKELLTLTNLTVSEIACKLGFEHSQSFNRMFGKNTNLSSLDFRQSFN